MKRMKFRAPGVIIFDGCSVVVDMANPHFTACKQAVPPSQSNL